MTIAQLNAEIYRSFSTIQKRHEDETSMSNDAFFSKIDHAREQANRGEYLCFDKQEDMNDWLNNL